MKRLSMLLLLGILVFAAAALALRWGGHRIRMLQLHTSDWATVKTDGLRMGASSAREDIVLVMIDVKTAAALGYVSSVAADAKLYQKLFDAGARVVYDTRPIVAADQEVFAEFKPLLDSMLEINATGRLMRDVSLSPSVQTELEPRYDPLFASNALRPDPHLVPFLRSRIYPLFQLSSVGISESAPLRICRQALDFDAATHDQIVDQARDSGVIAEWHRQVPDLIPLDQPPSQSSPKPYPLGEINIFWHPFTSVSMLTPPAGFWVSYDVKVEDYQRFSMLDLLESTRQADFHNKIVIIGRSAETDILDDPYEVPCKIGKASPPEVIAAAVQTLLDRRFMHELPFWVQIICIAILCLTFTQIGGWLKPILAIALSLFLFMLYFSVAVFLYRQGWFADFAIAPISAGLSGFVGSVYWSWATVQSRRRIVELFGRYVPRAVVNQLVLQPELQQLTLGGERREVSVLFADIRGFTAFSEERDPEDVVRQLNSLLEILVECTFENEGTLDKFIGDAILVLFNAPLNQPDHLGRAVNTAIKMQQRLASHATGLKVGIGLHRGEAVVGNVGTQQRLEYTAIGNTVNIASRLCALAEPGSVIVSAAVLDGIPDDLMTESLGATQIKGMKNRINAYRIIFPDR